MNDIRNEVIVIANNLHKFKFYYPAFADYAYESGNVLVSINHTGSFNFTATLMIEFKPVELNTNESFYIVEKHELLLEKVKQKMLNEFNKFQKFPFKNMKLDLGE